MVFLDIAKALSENTYPGRGIIIGKSADGKKAVTAYFIMGRSSNSRNRIFIETDEGLRTEAFDPSKLEDPSLIIYAPVRVLGCNTIVTNGDQTDTIFDFLNEGKCFEDALRTRCFEPDAPNFTPRVSGMLTVKDGSFSYKMSILKSANGNPACCQRYFFDYDEPIAGEGRFIHTYSGDGNPIPSFDGEPEYLNVPDCIDEFTAILWNNLNADNKVSLFVRYINLETGETLTRIENVNK